MNSRVHIRKRGRRGFTLIELLTVIAIIAILAALLFPILGTVLEARRQTECSNNLGEISRGLKMYHDDWGQYPDALFVVSYAAGGPWENRLGNVLKYVKSPRMFTCPNHPHLLKASQTAVAPVNRMTGAPLVSRTGQPLFFQQRDSYDFQYHPGAPTLGTAEAHYNLRWSASGNAAADDQRQLYRKNAPATTVITWCMYHTNMNAVGQPAKDTKAIVAYLDGTVRKIDAKKLVDWATPGAYPWQAGF
jgi:prepilin-type N-terminal cleavage/methylation domain-containing protein